MAHFYTGQLRLARLCVLRSKTKRPSVRFCVALLRTRGCTPCDASHLSLRTHERHSTANIRISFMGFIFSSTHFCRRGMEPVV